MSMYQYSSFYNHDSIKNYSGARSCVSYDDSYDSHDRPSGCVLPLILRRLHAKKLQKDSAERNKSLQQEDKPDVHLEAAQKTATATAACPPSHSSMSDQQKVITTEAHKSATETQSVQSLKGDKTEFIDDVYPYPSSFSNQASLTSQQIENKLSLISKSLTNYQNTIHKLEERYFEDTNPHNLYKGWDGFLDYKPGNQFEFTSTPKRRMPFDDRWFGNSSGCKKDASLGGSGSSSRRRRNTAMTSAPSVLNLAEEEVPKKRRSSFSSRSASIPAATHAIHNSNNTATTGEITLAEMAALTPEIAATVNVPMKTLINRQIARSEKKAAARAAAAAEISKETIENYVKDAALSEVKPVPVDVATSVVEDKATNKAETLLVTKEETAETEAAATITANGCLITENSEKISASDTVKKIKEHILDVVQSSEIAKTVSPGSSGTADESKTGVTTALDTKSAADIDTNVDTSAPAITKSDSRPNHVEEDAAKITTTKRLRKKNGQLIKNSSLASTADAFMKTEEPAGASLEEEAISTAEEDVSTNASFEKTSKKHKTAAASPEASITSEVITLSTTSTAHESSPSATAINKSSPATAKSISTPVSSHKSPPTPSSSSSVSSHYSINNTPSSTTSNTSSSVTFITKMHKTSKSKHRDAEKKSKHSSLSESVPRKSKKSKKKEDTQTIATIHNMGNPIPRKSKSSSSTATIHTSSNNTMGNPIPRKKKESSNSSGDKVGSSMSSANTPIPRKQKSSSGTKYLGTGSGSSKKSRKRK